MPSIEHAFFFLIGKTSAHRKLYNFDEESFFSFLAQLGTIHMRKMDQKNTPSFISHGSIYRSTWIVSQFSQMNTANNA